VINWVRTVDVRRWVVVRRIHIAGGALAIVTGFFLVAGCGETVETGDLVLESRSVDLDDAESVDARIRMGAGKLTVAGGADKLMEANFEYNVAEWKPEIAYRISGGRGKLTVEQPGGHGTSLGRGVHYEWDLRFNDQVPLDLNVELGAGGSYLDLGNLSVNELNITTGAGEVEVFLTGRPQVEDLDLQVGAGDVTVDLTGTWSDDLDADIKGGVGRVTLRLPEDVGVRVDAEKGIGKVSARGMLRKDGAYVNEAYGRSDVTLRIDCAAGIGSIILEMGEISDDDRATI
jgi:hypothetical protein